jgi:hypothetical protein
MDFSNDYDFEIITISKSGKPKPGGTYDVIERQGEPQEGDQLYRLKLMKADPDKPIPPGAFQVIFRKEFIDSLPKDSQLSLDLENGKKKAQPTDEPKNHERAE